jgi:hypothetical protein
MCPVLESDALFYKKHIKINKMLVPAGCHPDTTRLGGKCSIQLSCEGEKKRDSSNTQPPIKLKNNLSLANSQSRPLSEGESNRDSAFAIGNR